MERSLKEAASELKARIGAGRERRFPLMGLKGAANALMLREAALTISSGRCLVITPLASEAETLAGELAFFLDQPAERDAADARSSPAASVGGAAVRPSFAAAGSSGRATGGALRVASHAGSAHRDLGRGSDDAHDSAAHLRGLGYPDRAGGGDRSRGVGRGIGRDGLSARAADRGARRFQRARRHRRRLLPAPSPPGTAGAGRRYRHLDSPFRSFEPAIARRDRRGDGHSNAPRSRRSCCATSGWSNEWPFAAPRSGWCARKLPS